MISMKCVLFLLWITLSIRVCASPQGIPLSVVKLWASAFGGEIKSIAAKYSGSQLLQKHREVCVCACVPAALGSHTLPHTQSTLIKPPTSSKRSASPGCVSLFHRQCCASELSTQGLRL
ncbi:unnamed protein product [Leuciscus chuanchicus]